MKGYFVRLELEKQSHAQSTPRGVNQRSKDVTQTQRQRPESHMVTLIWHASKYKVHKLHQRYILKSNTHGMYIIYVFSLVSMIAMPFCQLQRPQIQPHLNLSTCSGWLAH